MKVPQWLKQVLLANESRSLDDADDRDAVAGALAAGIEHERDQVIEQVTAWLDQCARSAQSKTVAAFYADLAQRVRHGEWTS